MGRFSGWKRKFLSLAGRATLVQSVTSSIPIHTMQSTWLPENICNKLDKLNRNFLWSSDVNQPKMHLVGWKKVTQTKKDGGLCLREARTTNEALLAKMVWIILRDEKTVWSKLVEKKYLKGSNIFQCLSKPGDSPSWKGILRCAVLLKPFFRWRIGNGTKISFWYDNGLGNGALCTWVHHISDVDRELKLSELVDESDNCKLQDLTTNIAPNLMQQILEFKVHLTASEDTPIWSETSNGLFSCSSAYKTLKANYSEDPPQNRYRLRWIWKLRCCHKFKHFLWLAAQERLVTNKLRKDRKIAQEGVCSLCNAAEETTLHILRHCPHTKKFWEKILAPADLTSFNLIPDNSWLQTNLTRRSFETTMLPEIPWYLVFLATIWNAWKAINCRVFNRKPQHAHQTLHLIRQDSLDLYMSFNLGHRRCDQLRWRPPAPNWVKLNTDGSTRPQSNEGAIGGVLRDERGKWLWGFCKKLQTPAVDESELQALLHGLSIAWEKNVERLEVEVDSETVWKMVDGCLHTPPQFREIVNRCQTMLHRSWEVRFKHIQRTANGTADAMALLSYNKDYDGGRPLSQPPEEILPLLACDIV